MHYEFSGRCTFHLLAHCCLLKVGLEDSQIVDWLFGISILSGDHWFPQVEEGDRDRKGNGG